MATKNPRISVMLKPESYAILKRLAAVSKQSTSSIIASFLEDTCMPVFERMTIVLEAAATATDEAKAATIEGFANAEAKLLGFASLTTDLFDEASRPVFTDLQSVSAPPARSGSEDSRSGNTLEGLEAQPEGRPPYVTRGSGTPNTQNCTCTVTDQVRMENPTCPVHMPAKASKRPSKPRLKKVKG